MYPDVVMSVASSDFLPVVVLSSRLLSSLYSSIPHANFFDVFQGVEDVGLPEVQAVAPSHDHLLHRDHTVPRLFGQPTQVYKHPILRI